jgi:Beta propeller domain
MPKHCILVVVFTAMLALGTVGLATAQAASQSSGAPGSSLKAYSSEAELNDALARWREQAQRLRQAQGLRRSKSLGTVAELVSPSPLPAPSLSAPVAPGAPAALAAFASAMADKDSASSKAEAQSITNVQTAGVDEGGIVKRAGEYLVILRRGRLFTVRVGADQLQPSAMLDAYAPGSDPQGAWYDEMLISGNQVVVIGYSYARGGTEIGLFDLGAAGGLTYRATYHLRSFDYYSSRNYASRLVGNKLLFYTPSLLQPWQPTHSNSMPSMRRWHNTAVPGDFQRILPATRIFRTDDDFDPQQALALHTVTACDLGQETLQCEATAVLGPVGRVFYVSQGSVFVWTTTGAGSVGQRGTNNTASSALFRLPLDGSAPSALKTTGVPIDQLSFLEDGQGHLNVLLQAQGAGEGMWGAESGGGSLALLRVPLAAFGDGRSAAKREHYRRLPSPADTVGAMAGMGGMGGMGMLGGLQNRFVGDWLLWGGAQSAWALRYASANPVGANAAAVVEAVALRPGHAVERIEAMGAHAVLVGNAGADLHFSAVRLGRRDAMLDGEHVQPGAQQGESRTHGFFYRGTAAEEGLLGLPIVGTQNSARRSGFAPARSEASVVFLRQRGLSFTALGGLAARPGGPSNDGCKASCVDWYGNARPVFLDGRVFALMGYELVEGKLQGRADTEQLQERRRINFAPTVKARDVRPSPFE